MGYCNVENYSAVFRAISPSNNIFSYQESCPEIKISTLNRILRPHYKEKDGMSTFTKLCNTSWSQSESYIDFVVRLMCLRQVFTLAIEEDCPYDAKDKSDFYVF